MSPNNEKMRQKLKNVPWSKNVQRKSEENEKKSSKSVGKQKRR